MSHTALCVCVCVCVCVFSHTDYGPGYLSRYSDSLRAGRSGNRIPVGARFSAPVQTGPGAHSASYTMGTGSFPGVKRPRLGADHPTLLAPKLRKEYRYTYTPLLVLRGLFYDELYLPLTSPTD